MCARIHLLVGDREAILEGSYAPHYTTNAAREAIRCKWQRISIYQLQNNDFLQSTSELGNRMVVGFFVPSSTVSSFLSSTSCSISFLRSSWFKLQASKASLTNSETTGLVEISSSSWNATNELWKWFSQRQFCARAHLRSSHNLIQHHFHFLLLLVKWSLLSHLLTCTVGW